MCIVQDRTGPAWTEDRTQGRGRTEDRTGPIRTVQNLLLQTFAICWPAMRHGLVVPNGTTVPPPFQKKIFFCSNSVHRSGPPVQSETTPKTEFGKILDRRGPVRSSPSRSCVWSGPVSDRKLHTPSQKKGSPVHEASRIRRVRGRAAPLRVNCRRSNLFPVTDSTARTRDL